MQSFLFSAADPDRALNNFFDKKIAASEKGFMVEANSTAGEKVVVPICNLKVSNYPVKA